MHRNNLINMAWMQLLWFAAVIGAGAGSTWPSITLLLAFAAWQLRPLSRKNSDLAILPVAVFLGMILDSTWIRLGWIKFAASEPVAALAPFWILALWAGLALTLNHSLAWLQNRLLLSGCMAALVGPMSYLAAQRLGAVQVMAESWHWFIGLGISWGLTLPFLLWLADHLAVIKTEPL